MITVHHLNNSRAQRVLWLLEELGVPYELKHYQRDPKTMLAPASLRAIHPLGKSPVISDGENVVAESAAILEYLIDRYGQGRLRPEFGTPAHLRYRYFLHYAEGSVMPILLLALVFGRMPENNVPFLLKPLLAGVAKQAEQQYIGPQIKLHLDHLEGELKGRRWLVGDELTAADIQMSFVVEGAAVRAGLKPQYPELGRYLDQIRAQPAYQRALQRGGPFQLG